MDEQRDYKIKRLAMRSMRRGIKEMDLILSAYADATLDSMSDAELTLYDSFLNENDQDLYAWVTGQTPVPVQYCDLIDAVSAVFQK